MAHSNGELSFAAAASNEFIDKPTMSYIAGGTLGYTAAAISSIWTAVRALERLSALLRFPSWHWRTMPYTIYWQANLTMHNRSFLSPRMLLKRPNWVP